MLLQHLSVDRIIIHQIYRRDSEGNKVPPLQSHEYTIFAEDAMLTFKSRVTSALGHDSKAVQLEIVNQDPNYLPSLIDSMVTQDKQAFAVSSFDIAKKLTDSQHNRSMPGGIIVVFSGTQGLQSKKFLGIIKAEVHSGYEKEINPETNEISLKFVEEILLTPGSRLYKTAGFFENSNYQESTSDLNKKWTVMVSDYQINKTDGKAAAKYFYSDFLGCGYPQTSARTTKQFYEAAKSFITNLDVTPAKKSDLLNALTTYLKVDASSTVSASDFATRYFEDVDIQDLFSEHIEGAGLPTTAFTKDIEHIKSKLKFRRVSFKSNVRITAPSDVFKKLITIETIEGEVDESGNPTEWTQVLIKDRITQQE